MAVTPVGNPYVESSDLVANYPGASEALAERIDIVGVNPFANAAARDAAIPSPVQGQMCSLNDDNKGYRYDGSAWVLFSGAGNANFTNAATGTFSSGGISYKYITFTGSGDLIVDQAGFADVLLVAGGAGGGGSAGPGGGGGAGGHLYIPNAYLTEGSLTLVVGAGGAGGIPVADEGKFGNNGIASSLGGIYYSPGGGGGAGGSYVRGSTDRRSTFGLNGGSGGGSASYSVGGASAGGSGISGIGFSGGTATGQENAGGGGGGSAVGANGASATGGAGGAGSSSSITGTAVTRSGGGGGAGGGGGGVGGAGGSGGGGAGSTTTGAAGTTNSGGGAGGGGNAGGAGGSGVIIVRVVV